MSERYCNKCGYFGPDEIHNKPGHLYQCGYLSSPIQQPDTIQVSRAEYEELRRDAERYRWLREIAYVGISRVKSELWCFRGLFARDGESLDEAIDAAIKQEGE